MHKSKKLSTILAVCLIALVFVFSTMLTACGATRYVIAFVTNGGSAVEEITAETGTEVQAPTAPTREGYVFEGWYLDSAFSEEFNFPYTMEEKSFNLYAKWTAEYTATFNSNGGSAVAPIKAKALTKLTPPADPTKADRLFAGWCVDEECTIAFDFVMPNRNVTLYARWLKIEELSSIALNGWVSSDANAYKITEEGSSTVIEALEGKGTYSTIGVKIGYNVKQYSTFVLDVEGTAGKDILIKCQNGGVKAVESRYTMTGSSQRIIWTVKPENLTDGQKAMDFYMFLLPGTAGAGATVKVNGLRLYRTLADDVAYKSVIFYNSLGGTAVEPTFAETGAPVTAPAAVPKKPGYTFSGWCTDAECTKPYVFGTMPEGKTELYASYTANKEVTLTFNTNGGTEIAPIKGAATGAVDKGDIPAAPTRGNDIFGGWYADAEFTTPYDVNYYPEESTTVYARWCVLDEENKITLDDPFVAKSGGYVIDGKTVSVGAKNTYDMFGNQVKVNAKEYAFFRIVFTGTENVNILFKCQNGGVKAVETKVMMTGEQQTYLWKVSADNLPDGTAPMDFYMCIDPGKAYTEAQPDLKVTISSIELLKLKTIA